MRKEKLDNPWIVYFDGGCEPVNPGGVATYGCSLYDPDNKWIAEDYGIAEKNSTNNRAEFLALCAAVELAQAHDVEELLLRGDSLLVVMVQLRKWKLKKRHLILLDMKARNLLDTIPLWWIEWIPRELNSEADSLASRAYQLRASFTY